MAVGRPPGAHEGGHVVADMKRGEGRRLEGGDRKSWGVLWITNRGSRRGAGEKTRARAGSAPPRRARRSLPRRAAPATGGCLAPCTPVRKARPRGPRGLLRRTSGQMCGASRRGVGAPEGERHGPLRPAAVCVRAQRERAPPWPAIWPLRAVKSGDARVNREALVGVPPRGALPVPTQEGGKARPLADRHGEGRSAGQKAATGSSNPSSSRETLKAT